jgi:uncharacterized protein
MAQNNDDVDLIALRLQNIDPMRMLTYAWGARDIVAEWINENLYVRKQLRYQRTATVSTKVVKARRKAQKFNQYFDWSNH